MQDRIATDPMVFLSGPRQVGKTYLARSKISSYYNWDTSEVKRAYLRDPYFFRTGALWIVFDEVHKRRDWKKILKGYFDSPNRSENFVVTGSGRFDQYQRGGDSLQGRYDGFQLWPLCYDEVSGARKAALCARARDFKIWEPDSGAESDGDLISLGGFPQPFLQGQETRLRRWQDQYLDRLVKEDVRDFSAVHRLDQIDLLARLLPQRVGAPISIKALGEDIDASPVGVRAWLRLFETLFFGFSVAPYHHRIHRAVKKERKWYFHQWTFAEEPGARFENYLAVQLSAACSMWSERGFGRWELWYLRDQDRREVDFLITRDMTPKALFEAKASFQSWPNALHHYTRKLRVPGFLVYPDGPVRKMEFGWSLPSSRLLKALFTDY